MDLDTQTIKGFFDTASSQQFRCLMAEMDKMQDAEDAKHGKHIPIQLTVAIFAELIYRSEIVMQRRKPE